jgi:uncharacterized protein (DUF2342 family)
MKSVLGTPRDATLKGNQNQGCFEAPRERSPSTVMAIMSSLSTFVAPLAGGSVFVAIVVTMLTYVCLRELNQQRKFRHIPGPTQLPVLGNLMHIGKALNSFNDFVWEMARTFGPYDKSLV